jgi:hypothetical protein
MTTASPGVSQDTLARANQQAAERRQLHVKELRRARRCTRYDTILGWGTIVVAAATAMTVWPAAVATWVPGLLAVVTALIAGIRSGWDLPRKRAEHVDRACLLDMNAMRFDTLIDNMAHGRLDDAEALRQYSALIQEAEKAKIEAQGA